MSINDLTPKLRQLLELQAIIEEAQAEADSIKDTLKAEMAMLQVEELRKIAVLPTTEPTAIS